MTGYIKLHRDILSWEWYKDIPVRVLFEHCLLKANHESKRWQGITIEHGSFVTSRAKLAQETGLTEMQIRTAIKKLKSTGEITSRTTSEYTIISINNWNLYQQNNQDNNQRITSEQPANNQRITTNKNEKNEKNEKKNRECVRAREQRYIENDPFLDENVQKFISVWHSEVKKPCRLSPDERLKLLQIINDLLMQGLTIDDVCSAACENFKRINSRNDFGINWLLRDDNFYSIINGEWQKKELPKDAADSGGANADAAKVIEYINARKAKEKLENEHK